MSHNTKPLGTCRWNLILAGTLKGVTAKYHGEMKEYEEGPYELEEVLYLQSAREKRQEAK